MTAHVEYKGHMLPMLTGQQIVNLADEIQVERRRRVIEEAKAIGLEDEAKLRLIRQIDDERVKSADVVDWCLSAKGTYRVIEESVKAMGNGLKVAQFDLDMLKDWRVAMRLVGFEPPEVKEAPADAETDPISPPGPSGT